MTCLDKADLAVYLAVMSNPIVPQAIKDNWHCWFDHYVSGCEPNCGYAACAGNDPFNSPCGGGHPGR